MTWLPRTGPAWQITQALYWTKTLGFVVMIQLVIAEFAMIVSKWLINFKRKYVKFEHQGAQCSRFRANVFHKPRRSSLKSRIAKRGMHISVDDKCHIMSLKCPGVRYGRTHVRLLRYVRPYVRTYIREYVCTCVRTYRNIRTCVRTCVRTYIWTYVSMYVRTRTCVRAYVCTYVHERFYIRAFDIRAF
jgi:hypothetical protein